jgi:hypothetical protein
MTHEEIEKAVFERFPKLPIERTCATERIMRAAAREAYRKKLISYDKEGQNNSTTSGAERAT